MGILRRFWRLIDERAGLTKLVGPIARHPVPPGATWLYVFGSATLFVFIVQVVTGIVLATGYVQSAGDAYASLQFITHQALFGRLLRGIHYFAAGAMILLIGLHTIRVFLMASYKYPREVNWLTGVVLLGCTLLMGFTGQLLRWDQNGVWSVIVAAEQAARVPWIGAALAHLILGGDTVGGATLSRFFAVHVFFIPAVIFLFVGFHVYLVLHHGISEPPRAGRPVEPSTYRAWYERMLEREGRPFWPEAAWRDSLFGAAVVVGIVLLAWLVGPPELTKPPDPSIIQAYPRPDWYLLWYYAVLALMPPVIEPYVIVGGPLLVGLVLFLLPFVSNRGERSPLRRPWAMGAVLMTVITIVTFWRAGLHASWSPDFSARPLSPAIVSSTDPAVIRGAALFHDKGCEFCHSVSGNGGHRGPDLTTVGRRLTRPQMTIRILGGGHNMPAFGGTIAPEELDELVAFLASRR